MGITHFAEIILSKTLKMIKIRGRLFCQMYLCIMVFWHVYLGYEPQGLFGVEENVLGKRTDWGGPWKFKGGWKTD